LGSWVKLGKLGKLGIGRDRGMGQRGDGYG
jgi:hypothetical protein